MVLSQTLLAQIELEFIQPIVTQNDRTLELAFAGGINSAQYQTIDLDGDEDLDLIIFDRSSDKVNGFENTGDRYIYQPYFEFLFPENIQHWIVLADYDCDGYKDLFTYTGQGIRVFRNIPSENSISWDEIANPLKTQGSSSLINLFFNPTDIPSISDLDGDGDLDILVFDFASSSQIEYHQNLSVENTGSCGLDFVRVTRSYGDILDCGCDAFTVDEPCPSAGRVLHAGGKALLSMDYDNDGKMDLVLSQEACENLNYSENIGSISEASFATFNNTFPSLATNIGFTSFPSAFFEDVTFDGKKDIVVSSNERSNSSRSIDFKSTSLLFENTGINSENKFENSSVFLQDQMIDVGEFAYPAIVDIDGDGLNDLVIGNSGSLINDEFNSSISYYRATATGLVWQTDNLYQLSELDYTEIKPQFVDLNNDQKIDLVFSAINELSDVLFAYIINQGATLESLDPSQIQFLDVEISRLDDFTLEDIDDDGLPDLLVGLSNGQLNLYNNSGTTESPSFTLDMEEFLGISADNDRSNLSLTTGDLDGNNLSELITTDRTGEIRIYTDFISGNVVPQSSNIRINPLSGLQVSRFGRITKPAAGELFGIKSLAIGSIQGGVRLLATSSSIEESTALEFNVFPVPIESQSELKLVSNLSQTKVEIYSLLGEKLFELILENKNSIYSIDLSLLETGMYMVVASNGNQICSVKAVVSK